MINLDKRFEIEELDKAHALASIEQLPQQCEQAWQETHQISLPPEYSEVKNIVVCGMGASWLGAHIIQGLMAQSLKVPLTVVHDYHLPEYVTSETLVIASSYSGTTEETVSTLNEAIEKKAKIITISSGGTLAEIAQKNNYPHYSFTGLHNPANSPRLGLGYSIMAQLSFLSQLNLISITDEDVQMTINHIKQSVGDLGVDSENNEAKQLAQKLQGHMPIIVAGTFLLGNAHVFSNQFNETSKTFGTFMHIPELNHHLMEGLTHPKEVSGLQFIFLDSELYDEKIRSRIAVTKEVLDKHYIPYHTYQPVGSSKLVQVFDVLLFGSFVTFYLAMLNQVDPAPNPWVDYFKKRLKEIET